MAKVTKEHLAKYSTFIDNVVGNPDTELIIVHHPEVLGDNYEELVTNLNLIAEHEKKLAIVPPDKRSA